MTHRRFGSSFAILVLMLAIAAAMAACGDSPTFPSPNAPFSHTDLTLGTGATAAAGSTITVHYTGWLYDASKTDQKGIQFESSRTPGRTTFEFLLGVGQVIAGWDQGIVGMQVGGLRRLVIPPSLGYGASRNSVIPPNATLIFEVELLEVK